MHHDDHEHEHHHHDHDHDHDHEHHHHHDHDDPADEESQLHLEIHRAVDELGKYAIELDIKDPNGIPKDRLIKFVDDLMRTATDECIEHGADLIGHVKSFLRIGEDSVMFSMVHPEIPTVIQDNSSVDSVPESLLVMHIIVHGIWDDVIRGCALEVLPDVAKKWDIPYSIRADYFDTEKSIAHHEH